MSNTYDRYLARRREQSDAREFEQRIAAAVETGSEALAATREDTDTVTECVSYLLSALLSEDWTTVEQYSRVLTDEDWNRQALEWALRDPQPPRLAGEPHLLRRAFESLVAVAAHEGIVPGDTTNPDAVGWTSKIAEHIQRPGQFDDLEEPIGLMTRQTGALKTLYAGETGQGKSATLETEAEEYYRCNFDPDQPDYKLLDIGGFRDGENWFYDVPQQDEALRRVRREMDLPPDFTGEDRPEPDMEILVPLVPGLEDQLLPFDADSETFDVRPFAVPAADISKELLVSMLETRLTPEKQIYLRSAYDEVNRQYDDWALADLADAIRDRSDLSETKQKPVLRTLRSLQQQGFIRSQRSEYTVDWRALFEDSETITVFSAPKQVVSSKIARLILFGYLLDTIKSRRDVMHDVPQIALLIREFWKVVPHSRRNAFDARAAELQKTIARLFDEYFRENRKAGLHILADTQKVSDLRKSVRELFNRYVLFDTGYDTVESVMSWTGNDATDSAYNSITPETGVATVVGQVKPAVRNRRISFVGPTRYAPPAHHHRREDIDDTGWYARRKLLDRELRRPSEVVDWPTDVPDHLQIETDSGDTAPDPEVKPVAAFAHQCIRQEPGSALRKQAVYDGFNAFAVDHGHSPWNLDDRGQVSEFGTRLNSAMDASLNPTTRGGDPAYNGVAWTTRGEEYADGSADGLTDASEPIRGDD